MDTMTHSAQDKVKADWEKAQQQGSQRLDRIREIFQSAATAALSELKDGTLEVESLGRRSLADMIDQFKPQESAPPDGASSPSATESTEAEAAIPTDTPAPSWADILTEVVTLANDRKTVWTTDVISHLQGQLERFDSEMGQTYGDRYRPLQPLIQGLRSLLSLAYQQVTPPPQTPDPKPITIEVLDDPQPPTSQE